MAINSIIENAINFPSTFWFKGQYPLDARMVVDSEDKLTINNFKDGDTPYYYKGMIVGCASNGKAYILKSEADGFVELGSGGLTDEQLSNFVTKDQIGTLLSFAGSMDNVLTLPSPSKDLVGKTYNIRDQFTLEEPSYDDKGGIEFKEDGSLKLVRKRYPAGTNVVCYKFEYDRPAKDAQGNSTTEKVTSYRWDALGGVTEWDWEEVN